MFNRTTLTSFFVTLLFSATAVADPITIDTHLDGTPSSPGGYVTEDYTITGNNGDILSSFTTGSGNEIGMSPDVMVLTDSVNGNNWFDDPANNGAIFGVHGSMVTLTPTNPLAAISFIISSSFGGGAWVSADWTDSDGNVGTVRNPAGSGYFRVNQGEYDGVGVSMYAAPGACITSITIEPYEWGFGAISTADAVGCVSVPEPGSLGLMGLGLLCLGFVARRRTRIV